MEASTASSAHAAMRASTTTEIMARSPSNAGCAHPTKRGRSGIVGRPENPDLRARVARINVIPLVSPDKANVV